MMLIFFSKKKFVWGKWTILGPKMAHPQNSKSTVKLLKKFCRMKGADRYMKVLLVVFRRKISFGEI